MCIRDSYKVDSDIFTHKKRLFRVGSDLIIFNKLIMLTVQACVIELNIQLKKLLSGCHKTDFNLGKETIENFICINSN